MIRDLIMAAAGAGGPAISFVGSSFVDSGGANVTSITPTVPSGSVGDVLFMVFATNYATPTNLPSGWTGVGIGTRTAFFYKIATATSETVAAQNPGGAGGVVGVAVLRFSGTTTLPAFGTVSSTSGGASLTAIAVAGGASGDYNVQCFVSGGSAQTWSTPSVSNGTVFTDNNSFQPSIGVFYQLGVSSNATSTPNTGTSATDAMQVRLR